jgi:hypothetical protein
MDRSIPDLSSSPENSGLDPSQALPRLNLAGSDGLPSPAQIARSMNPLDRTSDSSIHTPDFGLPDMTMPNLHPYDLVAPGIDDYGADPSQPDLAIGNILTGVQRPYGLDIYSLDDDSDDNDINLFGSPARSDDEEDFVWPDITLDDLLDFAIPQDFPVINQLSQRDPTLPDMHHLSLDQDVHMSTRPGDLASGALDILYTQQTDDGTGGIPYPEVFMNQTGMNTTRRRHMDLLEDGLENW